MGNYDLSWIVERTWDNRISLIVDPSDGRVPPLWRRRERGKMSASRVG
jgi:hypothetical protein